MNYPKNTVFVRHAEMVGNAISHDEAAEHESPNHAFELTPRSQKQLVFTRDFLLEKYPEGFDVGFVSTFSRTQISYEALGNREYFPRPIIDSRLDERLDGIMHALTNEQIDRHFPSEQARRKKEGWYHYTAPGGRNGPDVELSIYSFWDMLCQRFTGKNCLIFTHGNWLLLQDRIMDNMTAQEVNRLREKISTPNCSITAFRGWKDGGFKRTLHRFVPWEGKM